MIYRYGRKPYRDENECIQQFKAKDAGFQNRVMDWVQSNLVKQEKQNWKMHSGWLKQICQDTIGEYVSSDDIKAVMMLCGFTTKDGDELYPHYNITKKSVENAQRR